MGFIAPPRPLAFINLGGADAVVAQQLLQNIESHVMVGQKGGVGVAEFVGVHELGSNALGTHTIPGSQGSLSLFCCLASAAASANTTHKTPSEKKGINHSSRKTW